MTTDLLTRDPNDSGEIPLAEHGLTTQNIGPYTDLPVFRRPTVEDRGCRTIDPDADPDEFLPGPPGTPPGPDPLPPPPPPTPSVDDRPLSPGEDIVWQPAPAAPRVGGRHRQPSRWDWLTVPLSLAAQRLSAAWSEK